MIGTEDENVSLTTMPKPVKPLILEEMIDRMLLSPESVVYQVRKKGNITSLAYVWNFHKSHE
jgi:hypothetical protein